MDIAKEAASLRRRQGDAQTPGTAATRSAGACHARRRHRDPGARRANPVRPIKMIVPFPPGGPIDTMARLTGQMSASLGQQRDRREPPRRRRLHHRLQGRRRGRSRRLHPPVRLVIAVSGPGAAR